MNAFRATASQLEHNFCPKMMYRYRPELDGLRAIAVLLVLLFHARLACSGGFIGVDVFFVLSGYLITGQILKDQQAGQFSLRQFWSRRIRRLFPAVLVLLVVVMAAGYLLLLPRDLERLGQAVMAQQLLLANVDAWKAAGYFEQAAELQPLLHMWSLAVEEQFYLLFPLLFRLPLKLGPRGIGRLLLATWFSSLAFSCWGVMNSPGASYYLLPTRAWELLCGSLLWFLPAWPQTWPRCGQTLGWFSMTSIIGCGVFYGTTTSFPGVNALLPCAATMLLIAVSGQRNDLLTQLLSLRLLTGIGLISYSLYLWHWPLLAFARCGSAAELTIPLRLGLLALSVVLAAVSWRFVEQPFRQRNPETGVWRIGTTSLLRTAAAAAGLCLVAGGVFLGSAGLPTRLNAEALRYHNAFASRAFLHEVSIADALAGRFPECGADSSEQTCVIWGDSHAMSLLPGLDAAAKQLGFRVLQATHSSTPPLLGFVPAAGFRRQAVDFNAGVMTSIQNLKPDLVILAAWWPGAAQEESFEAALQKTLRELQQAGSSVVIIRDVASLPYDVAHGHAMRLFHGESVSPLTVALTEHRAKNAVADQIMQRRAESFASVRIVDPAPWFLDAQGKWQSEADNEIFYADAAHLTISGSLRLMPMFLEVLRRE